MLNQDAFFNCHMEISLHIFYRSPPVAASALRLLRIQLKYITASHKQKGLYVVYFLSKQKLLYLFCYSM